jgi:hypothetical protein
MPKENPEIGRQIYGDVETLAPQTKMRMLLEIFDLGKDKEKNEERKRKFIELMGKYHQSGIRQRTENLGIAQGSDASKKKLHNEIMEIIRSISLSQGLSKDQERLTEYLARNREEVEKMIGTYFLGYNPSNPREHSELRQALRGEGMFTSPPGKEND